MSGSAERGAGVITEFDVPAASFELGRALGLESGMVAAVETVVATDRVVVPYLWVTGHEHDRLLDRVANHPTVDDITRVDNRGDRSLYALEWRASDDPIIAAVADEDAEVLWARVTESTWTMVVRFPSYESLVSFEETCRERSVRIQLVQIFNPTDPDAGPWYGLTERQREALVLAVERGYYDIPRAITTVELADVLGISDQAVTERLRRGIAALVGNTVLPDQHPD